MNTSTKKGYISGFIAIVFTVMLLTVYLLDPSLAWFTDDDNFINEDEIAQIEMDLLGGNDEVLLSVPDFTYTGAGSHPLVIKAKNTANSNISSIVRIMITATWSNNLPVYNEGNTVNYNFNSSVWIESSVGSVGFNYVYYNSVLAPGQSVTFLEGITFPALSGEYLNQTLSISVAVTGLQANAAGVNLWKTQVPLEERAPAGWNPLGV